MQQVDPKGTGTGGSAGGLVLLEAAALAAGATVLGDPPHYLMTAEELERFVALLAVPAPPY